MKPVPYNDWVGRSDGTFTSYGNQEWPTMNGRRISGYAALFLAIALALSIACSHPNDAPLPSTTANERITGPTFLDDEAVSTGSMPLSVTTPTPWPSVGYEESSYTRQTPFVPLDDPVFLTPAEATYLQPQELVLGLEWAGQARAYPIRMLHYHHIVNDTVGGRPILLTY